MVFEFIKKYRDILYLATGLVALVLFIKTCNKPQDLSLELDNKNLIEENKRLKKNISVLDDSLRVSRFRLDSISKIEVKTEKRRNKVIVKGNEELKNIYTKSDSATHELFARYLAREDSIYKGLLPGINIIPREVN